MQRVTRILDRASALTGWRRSLLLFATGALCVFLFAPFDAWLLLFVLIPLFFTLLNAAPTRRRALADGFFFGYGYFMAGTYWIAISLTVDADKFAWMIPFSLFGLSACFTLYFIVLAWLYHALKTPYLTRNVFLFAALWVTVEYLRSIGIFGFPWNLIGYSLVPIGFIRQAASLSGIFGLSLLTMLAVMSIVPLVRGATKRYAQRFHLAAIALIAGLLALSAYNKSNVTVQDTRIRIVQPNIPQQMKWEEGQVNLIMRTLGSFTQLETDADKPDIIVWPETAVPFTLHDRSDWLPYVAKWIPASSILITGAVTQQADAMGNGLAVIDHKAQIQARYAKRQLVPFGEFIPLRTILPLDKIAPGPVDFTRGTETSALTPSSQPPFQPMICYESAFPWLASSDGLRPKWLLTITNDAWFGNSPGPYQHFAMSRVRAVEQGLPVVRAANTGISAVIDANGNVVKSLKLGTQGIIDVALPAYAPPTIYSITGEYMPIAQLLTIYLLALVYRRTT